MAPGLRNLDLADFTPKPRGGNDDRSDRGTAPDMAKPGTCLMRFLPLFATLLVLAAPVVAAKAPPAKAKASKIVTAPAKKRPAAAVVAPMPQAIAPLPDTPEIAELRRAFRFAFPIYEVLRTRGAALDRARAAGLPSGVNVMLPRLTLADANSRQVTTPNNDTLYASAWLDLAAGPVIVTMPDLAGRYHSAALMSLTTDNTAIIGTRTGGQGGRHAIVGPGFAGVAPDGTQLIRSASNDAWLLIRVLVDGPKDLDAAARALQGFGLEMPADRAAPVPTTAPAPARLDAATFVAAVNEALARSADAPALQARAAAHAGLGIGTSWASLTGEQKALWTASLPALIAELKPGLASAGDTVNGWSYPRAAIGDFGDDDDLRSFVALGGLGALPRIEAIYLTARSDAVGVPLEGSQAYTATLPPRLPAGAFWSLTMYQVEADGRQFFVPNSLDRFAVGDRSPQLRSNRNGSYDIFIQTTPPTGERVVNWLPAPPGKFALVWRAYLPKPELLDGSFRLPPVAVSERIE